MKNSNIRWRNDEGDNTFFPPALDETKNNEEDGTRGIKMLCIIRR